MNAGVALIMFSDYDLNTLLPLARKVLGRSLSDDADKKITIKKLHNMACVASFSGEDVRSLGRLYYASFLIVADERDLMDVLSITGMASVVVDTTMKGIKAVIISGPLVHWKEALINGTGKNLPKSITNIFNLIYKEFDFNGIHSILKEMKKVKQLDGQFLLERK